jgi:hypothetical protein
MALDARLSGLYCHLDLVGPEEQEGTAVLHLEGGGLLGGHHPTWAPLREVALLALPLLEAALADITDRAGRPECWPPPPVASE